MLNSEFLWEFISDRERLVLLAIAFELQRIKSEGSVMEKEAMQNSGLSEEDFWTVLKELEEKELVEIDQPGNTSCCWIRLAGGARSKLLLPKKVKT